MIKINLSTTKKQVDLSNLGGFDFTQVKIKLLLIVIVLIYLPDFFLISVWEEETATANQELTTKQNQLRSLERKVSQSQILEKQIRELKAQEENLEKKLTAVKEAIAEKKNPAAILLYISKNIPPDLWLKELLLDGDVLIVKGEALDFVSIGTFITSLKSSIFIKDASISNTTSVVRESDKRRIETFEAKLNIARFNQ